MFLRSPAISGTGDGSFRRSPLAEFGVGARSFAANTLCCRVGRVWSGRSRGRGGPGGARESRSKTEQTETGIAVKIQNDVVTTTITMSAYYRVCFAVVSCNTSGRLKIKAPTTHTHSLRTAVLLDGSTSTLQQYNSSTYSTLPVHEPSHHVQQHNSTYNSTVPQRYVSTGFPCFCDPPPERGSSNPVPGSTFPRLALAELNCGARSFAEDTLGCHMGWS